MIGTTLGPYRLTAELGSGGMGRVYRATVEGRARGLEAGAVVALKLVYPHLLEQEGFFKRFLREADIGRAVVHENVVRTLDADVLLVDGKPQHFLVMELVEGQTLRELLRELDRVPEDLCRHVGCEIAKGLAAIHAVGVVHRDVKPENVLITRSHVVKIMDLGVARGALAGPSLTQTGVFVGSLLHAAPEQLSAGGDALDGRTDLFGLGTVLYELATGVHPFHTDEVSKTLQRILSEEPVRVGTRNPQVSPFFEEVIHTLLSKSREARFASASELVRVLEEGETSPWWRAKATAIRTETRRPLRRIRIPRETALHGREAELERIRALYARAKEGDGQVVLLEGEAGIGKSRLVDECVALLQREGEDIHFLFGSYPPGGAATASGAFCTAYREQLGAEALEETLKTVLPQSRLLVPAFAALLRGESTPPGSEALTKDSLQTCFVLATHALAAERTTIVLIDDLHFAPEEGRALFTALAMAVPGHRILLFGSTRRGPDDRWLGHFDRLGATRLPLARLGPKDVARLLVDALRSERLAEELGWRILSKSDGNPFFVFEILRGLREGRMLTQHPDGTWGTTGVVADIQIPSSILDLVGARLADLDAEDRDLLDVASCAGFEFDPALVAAAVGAPVLPVLKRFAAIERRHALVRAAGRRLVFDHHQVQESIYGALYEQTREAYHAALGEALEARHGAATKDPAALDGALCVELAQQLLEGAQGEKALRYLDGALTHLERSYLNEAALALADRALAMPGLLTGAARVGVLTRKAERLQLLGRREPERAALDEALALSDALGAPLPRARVRRALGEHLWRTSRYAEAETALEAALPLFQAVGDRAGETAATRNLGIVAWHRGRLAEARARFERCIELSRELGDAAGVAGATANLGVVLDNLGLAVESRAKLEEGRALARSIGHRQFEAVAIGNLGLALHGLGRFEEAQAHFERHLDLAREIGDRQGEASASGNLGLVLRAQGRFSEARSRSTRHLELSREIGYRKGEALAERHLGYTSLGLGDLVDARVHFDRALEAARQLEDRLNEWQALVALATLDDEEGDVVSAGRRFDEAARLRGDGGGSAVAADACLVRGAFLTRQGRCEEARVELDAALASAKRRSVPDVEVLVHAWRTHLSGDVIGEAIAAAEQGLRDHGARLAPPARMQAHWLLFRATGSRAHAQEARRMLDAMLALAPKECREPMRRNVRLHREILAH